MVRCDVGLWRSPNSPTPPTTIAADAWHSRPISKHRLRLRSSLSSVTIMAPILTLFPVAGVFEYVV